MRRFADQLPSPDRAERLDSYLGRLFQPYKVKILISSGAIEVVRNGRSETPTKPTFVVQPRDLVFITDPPPDQYDRDIARIPASDYRDLAYAPVGDSFHAIIREAYQLRPQTVVARAEVRSLKAFLREVESVKTFKLPLTEKVQPQNPVRDLIIVAHAFVEGFLKIPMDDDQQSDSEISYEDLEKADASGLLKVSAEDLLPRPKGADGAPIPAAFHIKGCRIGRSLPYLKLLKKALGGQLPVTAPRHYHVAARHTNPEGRIEYMMYGFRLAVRTALRTQQEAITAFANAAFTLLDDSTVPKDRWSIWIPRDPTKEETPMRESVVLPTTGNAVDVDALFQHFEDELFTSRSFIDLPRDPGPLAARKRAIQDHLVATFGNFSPTHPFPYFVRVGYPTMDAFMDGWTWDIGWDESAKKLSFVAKRHIYQVRRPIVDLATRRLFLNFYPAGDSGTPLIQLRESDTRFFASV